MATISGMWLFNEEISMPSVDSYTFNDWQKGRFVSCVFNETGLHYDGTDLEYRSASDDVVAYNFSAKKWENSDYRSIDFGTTPQTVSDAFYEWFTSNAVKCYTISGKWKFNKTISIPTWTSVNVNFTNFGGDLCDGFYCHVSEGESTPDRMSATGSSTHPSYSFTFNYWELSDGENSNYRVIDFGTTPQTVSEKFYTWFTANATKKAEEATYTISGTWVFNRELNIDVPADGLGEFVKYDVKFLSNGQNFDAISFAYGYYDGDPEVYYCSGTEMVKVVDCDFDDSTIEYSTITFDGEQTVNEVLYNWITEYAVKRYTISGKWKFNEVLTKPTKSFIDVTYFYSSADEWDTQYKIIGGFYNGVMHYTYDAGDDTNFDLYVYKFESNSWLVEARSVDFGETPQTVSEEFYTWFTSNATEMIIPTLKGKWLFNDSVTKPTSTITQFINFNLPLIAGRTEYSAIRVCPVPWDSGGASGDGYIGYRYWDSDDNEYTYGKQLRNFNPTYFDNDKNRLLDFGETPQTVSEEFYTWFTANAKPTTYPNKFTRLRKGPIVALVGDKCFKKLSTQVYELSGLWLFNTSLTRPNDYGFDYPAYVPCMSGENAVSQIYYGCFGSNSDDKWLMYVSPKWVEWVAYVFQEDTEGYKKGWHGTRYLDFGQTPVAVSKAFYNWFIANASKVD